MQLYVTLRREDKFWKPKSLGLKIALEKYFIRYVLVISIRFPPFKPITDFFILRDFKVAYLKNSCYIYARFTKKLARFTKNLARFTKNLARLNQAGLYVLFLLILGWIFLDYFFVIQIKTINKMHQLSPNHQIISQSQQLHCTGDGVINTTPGIITVQHKYH